MTTSPPSSLQSTLAFLSKTTGLFLIVRIVGACASIGLLPLFTRYLTPSEYGIIALLDTTVAIFAAFCTAGLGRAVARFYHSAADNQQRRQVVSTAMLMTGAITICALVALPLLSSPIASFTLKSHEYDNFVLLAISAMLLDLPGGIATMALETSGRYRIIYIIELVRIVFSTSLKIYLVVFLRQGVDGVLWTNLISAVLFSGCLALWTICSVGIHIDRSLIRPMLRYGMPFIPTVLSSIGMHSLNRFYLGAYTTSEQVAYYQLALQFPFALNSLILNSFEAAWSSRAVFTVAKEPDALHQYSRISTYFLALLSFLLFSVAISAKILVKIFAAPSYAPAAQYIPFVAFGLWLYTFHVFVRTGVTISKDTYLMTINYGLTLGATVLLNWILIPRFGAYGAAYATVMIYFFFSFAGGFIYKGFQYLDLRRLTSIAIIWVSLVLLRNQIDMQFIYTEILCDIFFSVLYLFLILYLPFCTSKKERIAAYDFIKNILKQKINTSFAKREAHQK
ncbi:MAG: oligosaccharide flippase family protein [Desulfobulbaceae bacterium]|jgi:O-antigen/teichoic acid export membrane protein|nr:oligosaccharide flippase family protein [Desulfobulbaceae bacterium]